MSLTDPTGTLIIVDVQLAIDNLSWALHGPRNNTHGETNIARLLSGWRRTARPIVHVRHDSTEPHSPYRPGGPGHAFKPQAMPLPGETVVGTRVNSAFIGTDLEARLRSAGALTLAVLDGEYCRIATTAEILASIGVA